MGWGGPQPRAKSQKQLAVERRRALVAKFGAGDISELVAIAAKSKKKPKVLPSAPPVDDAPEQAGPEVVNGPCQRWCENQRAWRVASKITRPVTSVVDDTPYVSDREKKQAATRKYHRQRNLRLREGLPSPKRKRAKKQLVTLKADQAQVQADSRRVEADIGPLRYAATLIGLDSEQALRLLILLMVLCCDPMAIVLVIAASARRTEALVAG